MKGHLSKHGTFDQHVGTATEDHAWVHTCKPRTGNSLKLDTTTSSHQTSAQHPWDVFEMWTSSCDLRLKGLKRPSSLGYHTPMEVLMNALRVLLIWYR